jgi:hypothetical protein
MGIDQLTQLLADAASDVPPPRLAESAWSRAVQIRRRRRVAGTTAVAAAVLGSAAIGVAVPLGGPPSDNPPTAPPSVSVAPSAPVDRMPASLDARAGVALPRTPSFGGTGTPRLSSKPVSRAVALYESTEPETRKGPNPIFVLGTDGTFRWLDLANLEFAYHADKSPFQPLTSTALSPDGRLAAFPQSDSVLVVDLTTGRAKRYGILGFNEHLVWHGAGMLLVGQAGKAFWIDTQAGTVYALASTRIEDIAGDAVDTHPLFTVPTRVTRWQGPAWRTGSRVLRAGRNDTVPVAVVVDVDTKGIVRTLALPEDGTALGWLDDHTALVSTAHQGVLAWDITSGQVSSVAAPFAGTLAVALGR